MKIVDNDTFDTLADEWPTASWAIWSDDFPDEGCIEEDPTAVRNFLAAPEQRKRMQADVVFAGLNPSGELPGELSNFHGVGHQAPDGGIHGAYDYRLKTFIQDAGLSELIGGYMTDVSGIKANDSDDVEVTNNDCERFAEQLRVLDQDQYTIIMFGVDAFQALRRSLNARVEEGPVSLKSFSATIAERPVTVYRVYHYSYRYGGDYIPKLRAQLAYLSEMKKQ